MSDLNSDLLTQEVDDEVRRERMINLWKSYGKYLIGIAVGIVAIVAGTEGYDAYVKSVEQKNSSAFEATVEAAAADSSSALKLWEDVTPTLSDGYGALAQLRLAAAAIDAGDMQRALDAYDGLAANSKADTALRDFAQLQAGMLMAGKMNDLDAARGRLAAIALKGNAWYFSAQEQLALIDLRQGMLDEALSKFTLLADDAQSPQTVKTRASQFRSFIEAKQMSATETSAPAVDEPAGDTPEAETAPDTNEEGEAQ
ncbi:tetratricopeptide repeat protein [Kordiimonas aestuarii]|uniref:tetratricopeptide repeat protein n=1 Tax=Kordiimonas aestuarii TaxID=1005925 RepID=UPI0021D21642|nr:tetratricopeptide repeat protein [Kordiimonas aestuarii]